MPTFGRATKGSKPSFRKSASPKRKSRPAPEPSTPRDDQRLQRVLAAAGFGSRRECETFILEGRVEVDGNPVTELGTRVDPNKQKIYVDGELVKQPKLQYFALNKPSGVVSTASDPTGRTRVIDLINTDQRVYNVGRLDKSSEGLILVTNDGELANRLTHPRYGVEKTYLVRVVGRPHNDKLKELRAGVYLAEGLVKVNRIRIKKRFKTVTELEIVLDEGRNREIRRLLAKIGHKVLNLRRVSIGPLRLADLPSGAHRRLTADEVKSLRRATQARTGREPRTPRRDSDSAGRRKKVKPKKKTPTKRRS